MRRSIGSPFFVHRPVVFFLLDAWTHHTVNAKWSKWRLSIKSNQSPNPEAFYQRRIGLIRAIVNAIFNAMGEYKCNSLSASTRVIAMEKRRLHHLWQLDSDRALHFTAHAADKQL